MTRSVRIRLVIFAVLAAVGIAYVGASYFGLTNTVLGRNIDVGIDLPSSGGLYAGSSVDYRGVDVGKVTSLEVTKSGVHVSLQLQPGTRIPAASKVRVEDLSAVGEQYVNFLPSTGTGPYLGNGDTVRADAASLPLPTEQLLGDLDTFSGSINTTDLRTVVSQLGAMFQGNATNLRRLVDASTTFVGQATAHQRQTIELLESGKKVLATQQAHSTDIRSFASGLSNFTHALKVSDPQLRTILQGGSSTVREVRSLVDGLTPVLPTFIANLVTVNQVFTARLPALEQTLVTFPLMLSNGFVGTPGDGYGHLNMQLTYTTPVCSQGYEPPAQWLPGTATSDPPTYPAKCSDPRAQPGYSGSDGILQRGVNMVPPVSSLAPYAVAGYDPTTMQTSIGNGKTVTMTDRRGGLISLLKTKGWEKMLVGPVTGDE